MNNPIGFRTLLMKETRRFLRVPGQTLAQPVVTTTLYFIVFGFALGGSVREVGGVPYVRFIVPGLVMLSIIQNAFLNSSSSMFVAKLTGTVVDLLVAPLSIGELLAAFTFGAVARGITIGAIVWVVAGLFTGFQVASIPWVLAFSFAVAVMFGLLGLGVAIASDSFEQLNLVPTFVITPLTFLGGVFYSVRMLPEPWQTVARANPVLYLVDGIRYGLIGHAETSPWVGLAITAAAIMVVGGWVFWMLATGYKLRH
jgi:ABC-2 type transport system permease protein